MSKSITIAEGSQAKNFNTVHKLRTNLIGGGTQYWVPEDEAGDYAKLMEKTITSNGTYIASEENKDGYSKVTVNVEAHPTLIPKDLSENGTFNASDDGADGYSQVTIDGVDKVTGIDDDGDESFVTKDNNGKLVTTKMPSRISITTNPSKMSYIDGESISTNGMVVKGYYATGGEWGVVPGAEITIVPTKASWSKSIADPDMSTSDLNTSVHQPIPHGRGEVLTTVETSEYNLVKTRTYWPDVVFIRGLSDGVYNGVVAATTPGYLSVHIWESKTYKDGTTEDESEDYSTPFDMSFTHNNRTVYYGTWTLGTNGIVAPIADGALNGKSREIAWTMIYGDTVKGDHYQTIKVKWPRPGDGKVLETTFRVQVLEA